MSSEALTSALVDTFEKLLKLEQGAATPGEAEAAAAAMTRLLTKHNLDMLEVHQRLGTQAKKIDMVKEWVEVPAAAWRKSLLWTVSKHNFTTFIYYKRGGYLIGSQANIETTRRIYLTLVDTVIHLADLAWPQHKFTTYDTSTTWKNAFRLGAVSGIGDAMRRAKLDVVIATEGGSALVLVNQRELDEAVARFCGPITTSKASTIVNADAYRTGYKTGQGVNVGGAGALKGG